MPAWLRILRKNGEEGRAFSLNPQQEISVGSSALATMRPTIRDARFKPVHCVIKVAENGVATLINKAPLCPVQVNNQNVLTSRCLRPWDTITIIDFNMRYENTNTTDEFLQLINEEFIRSLSKQRHSLKMPNRQISLTPNPKKREVPRVRRSNSFPGPNPNNITMRKSERIQCANGSFKEANISQSCLMPSKVPSTPQVRLGLKVLTPSSVVKPTLRNEVIMKQMSTSIGLKTPSGLNLIIKNSGDWEESDHFLKTPVTDAEDLNFNTPLSNTSIIEIDSPMEESTPMRSRKSQAKSISLKRLTQNDDSTKTPKAVVTPKSALKKSKIMAELLENTKESVFESTVDSDYTVESLHDITDISMKSNRKTPKRSVRGRKSTQSLKFVEETVKESVIPDTQNLENSLNRANIDTKKRKLSSSVDSMSLPKKLRLTRASLSTVNSFNVSCPEIEHSILYSSPTPKIMKSFNSSRQSRGKTPKTTVNSARKSSKTPRKRSSVLPLGKRSLTLTPTNQSSNDLKTKTPKSVEKVLQTPNQSSSNSIKKPLTTPRGTEPKNQVSTPHAVKRQLKSPKNDLSNPYGVKKLLKTPKTQKEPHNDLSRPHGVKKLLKTPKVQKEPHNDLSNPYGVKKLLKTPKVYKEPCNDLSNPYGVKKLLKTPKQVEQKEPLNDLTNPHGIKRILRTPRSQKEPLNDLSNPQGVKQLFATRKAQKEPKNDLTNPLGVKQLMTTPKVQKEPKNDLSNPLGVKQLMTTRKAQKEHKNDLSNPLGIKQLMTTRKEQKEPFNDLSNPIGVKQLLRTPKAQKEPRNDLSNPLGVKQLLRTPKTQNEPENDLTNPHGIKRLLRTPKQQKEPLNDLTNPGGIKRILRTPRAEVPSNNLEDPAGVETLFKTPVKESKVNDQVLFKTPKVPEFSSPVFTRVSKTPTNASPRGVKRHHDTEDDLTPVKRSSKTPIKQQVSRTPDIFQEQPVSPRKRLSRKSQEIVDEKILSATSKKQETTSPRFFNTPIQKQEIRSTSPAKRLSRKSLETPRLSKTPIKQEFITPKLSRTPRGQEKEEIVYLSPAKRLSKRVQEEMENADNKTSTNQNIERLSRTPRGSDKRLSKKTQEIEASTAQESDIADEQEIESVIQLSMVEYSAESPLKRSSKTPKVQSQLENVEMPIKSRISRTPIVEASENRLSQTPNILKENKIEAVKVKSAPVKRGRRKNTKEIEDVKEVEVRSSPAKRGRRKKVKPMEEEELEELLSRNVEPQEEEVVKSTPAKRNTRKNTKQMDEMEQAQSTSVKREDRNIEEPQEAEKVKSPPAKRGRRKNVKQTNEGDEGVKSTRERRGRNVAEEDETKEAQEVMEDVKPPRRGRRNAAIVESFEESHETEDVKSTLPVKRGRNVAKKESDEESHEVKSTLPKRGRRNVAEENVEDLQEEQEVKILPSKRGRRNVVKEKLEEPQEEKEVKSTPVKRGRRNVAKAENFEELQEVKEVKTIPPRRGRRKVEDIQEPQEIEETKASPTKKARRNATKVVNLEEPQGIEEAKPLPAKRGRRNVAKKEEPEEVIEIKSTPPKRGRRKFENIEEPQEVEEVKPTLTKRGRKKKNDDEPQEAEEIKRRRNVVKLQEESLPEELKGEGTVEQVEEPKKRARGKKVAFAVESPVRKTRRLYSADNSPIKGKRTTRRN